MHDRIAPADLPPRLDALAAAVLARTDLVPGIGIVLGSGLGGLAAALEAPLAIPFTDLPGWPPASAPGHAGRLLLGHLAGVPVVLLQGRLHVYEGHDPGLVVQPVLLMGRLGAGTILLTNAAGGVNAAWPAGTLMAIADHLNLTGLNPLVGPNADRLGPRFPDLTDAWSPRLRALLHEAAADADVVLEEGVYAGLLGPNYETPAEVRMLRALGADAVGLSAVGSRWSGPLDRRGSERRQLPPGGLRHGLLLGPCGQHVVLVRPDGAVLVAVAVLVAIAQRHALGGQERAEEGAHPEDLVADELEEPPDLPLGHRAQSQPGHVDERAQVRGHDQVRARHAADGEREDDVFDRRAVPGLDDLAHEVLLLLRCDPALRRAGEDLLRPQLAVAGAAGRVDERQVVLLGDLSGGEEELRAHAQVAGRGAPGGRAPRRHVEGGRDRLLAHRSSVARSAWRRGRVQISHATAASPAGTISASRAEAGPAA